MAFFFGVFGAHRFYVGKIRTASLQLGALGWCILLIIACAIGVTGRTATGILLGFSVLGIIVWAAIDCILILCKAFTDGQGRRITNWLHPQAGELNTAVSPPANPPSPPPPGGAAPSTVSSPSRTGPWPWLLAAVAGVIVIGLFCTVVLVYEVAPDRPVAVAPGRRGGREHRYSAGNPA
jgi:hypothetical protein